MDFRLKYKIDADSTDAKRAIADIDSRISKVGAGTSGGLSGLASGLSSLAGPAATAATGIAAVSAAAVTAGAALYNITKQAADYGSSIFDAYQKTGLSTDALQALKSAAEKSGNSFEGVVGAVAKFNVLLGEANEGSKKAQETLAQYGITATDTTTALEQAIVSIAKMESTDRQAAAAKALFKDRTAEILPVIKSFDGDLPGLINKLRDMGLLMSKENVQAADALGDQMDLLSDQMAGVGRTIGTDLMPIFLTWSTKLSDWLAQNRGEVQAWSKGFVSAVEFSASSIVNNADAFIGFAQILSSIASMDYAGASAGIQRISNAIIAQQGAWKSLNTARRDGLAQISGAVSPLLGPDRTGASRPVSGGGSSRDDSARLADQAERDRVARVKESISAQIAEKQASTATLIALEKQRFAEGIINEDQYVRNIREHETGLSSFIIDAKQRELDELRNHANEKRRLDSEIKILNSEQERDLAEYAENDAKRLKDRAKAEEEDHKKRVARWNERRRIMKEIAAEEEAADEAARKRSREQSEASMATAPGTLYGGIMGGLGVELAPMFDEASNAMLTFQDRMNAVRGDINTFVGESIGGMIQGLTQMAVAWISTGEFSAKAALQMLSSVAFSIASQAAIKAVFEAAEAVAAAARWDFVAAGLHSTAATMYSSVAVIAGAAGVGLALGARAAGGGSKSGSSSSRDSIGSSRGQDANMSPISRQNQDTFISRRDDSANALAQAAAAIDRLEKKISSMKPGDVVTAGAKQASNAIAQAAVQGIRSNSKNGTDLQRSLGMT